MSTLEENRALVRRIIEEGLNEGRLEIADAFFSDDYVSHIPRMPQTARGPDVFKRVIGMWRSAFSDWHMTIEDLVAESDRVVNRFTTRGTHDGELMGIPPTGNRFELRGIEMHRIADGKVVESWIGDDIPSILVQLGVLPPLPVGKPQPAPTA